MTGFAYTELAAAAGNAGPAELAAAIGVTVRTVRRWRDAGTVPAHAVDAAAVRLGRHPAEIWPAEWNEHA